MVVMMIAGWYSEVDHKWHGHSDDGETVLGMVVMMMVRAIIC
jgi:hypothetical protein